MSIDSAHALARLRRRWLVFALICLIFLVGGTWVIASGYGDAAVGLRWLVLTGAGLVYLLMVLGNNLTANQRAGETELLPGLGAGNWLTLGRGALIAGLVGFLAIPQPAGRLAWAPGILYVLACAADFFDGYLARRLNQATRLGEILDLSFDGLGVLAAALLVVLYGQAPVWYLSVALARYAFLAGLAIRRKFGWRVFDLPYQPSRRALAGVQMGLMAVLLLPIFTPPGTTLAAALFALPFLIGFLKDWFLVSGTLRPSLRLPAILETALRRWLPVGLRLAALVLAAGPLWNRLAQGVQAPASPPASLGLALLEAAVVSLLAFGAAGRITALIGMLIIGFDQAAAGLTLNQTLQLAVFVAIFFAGTGALSLWMPEERWISVRAGTPRPAGKKPAVEGA